MPREAFKTLIDIVKPVNIEQYTTKKYLFLLLGPIMLCLYSGSSFICELLLVIFGIHRKLLLLKKNSKYIFIAAEMQKQDLKFPKYYKAHTFQDIAGKTQGKHLKVNMHTKNCKKCQ